MASAAASLEANYVANSISSSPSSFSILLVAIFMDFIQLISHFHISSSFVNDKCLFDSSSGIFGFVDLR
tara:strand:- start:308 stop:514 length:207 start_codon:yes stop_codon:yes gene_type:complete